MKTIDFEIEVVDENCTGCYRCERVCPTEAIVMVGPKTEALAVVDNDKCIACMRCIDSCDDDALLLNRREEPIEFDYDAADVDPQDVLAICQSADIAPGMLACPCASVSAQEVAVTILHGARSLEDLSLRIGVQAGCLLYCSATLQRLLIAATGEAQTDSKVRRYSADLSLKDINPELHERYPQFKVREEQAWRRAEQSDPDIDL